MVKGFNDEDLVIRVTGDTIALTPPLIVSEAQIGEIFDKVGARDQGGGLSARRLRAVRSASVSATT